MNTDFNPPLQKYAPEGEPLHAIIEEYADSQDAWLEFFLPGCEKDSFYFIMFAALDLLSCLPCLIFYHSFKGWSTCWPTTPGSWKRRPLVGGELLVRGAVMGLSALLRNNK